MGATGAGEGEGASATSLVRSQCRKLYGMEEIHFDVPHLQCHGGYIGSVIIVLCVPPAVASRRAYEIGRKTHSLIGRDESFANKINGPKKEIRSNFAIPTKLKHSGQSEEECRPQTVHTFCLFFPFSEYRIDERH